MEEKKLTIPKGYRCKKEESIEELKSQAYLLEHEKSGANIVILKNEDDNKVFSAGFRTPPKDSTGVAHIVEHSVLCGSREFPVKDPFVELVKGSLNTFLNAMTYSDKTMYPVASCNNKDFQNLVHVYLDAVFYPAIYEKKEIFKQEGWHYELNREEDEITYNGVVYNEMKGAFSSPEQLLFRTIQSSLFPDTAYGTESGGEPACIPDLSYEDFLDFHRRYYHPSNSYLYFYGDMDVEEKLIWLDSDYLSHFNRISVDSRIEMQKPFACVKEKKEFYSLSEEESAEKKCYLSYNRVIETSLDRELYLAFQILEYALLGASGAPLKQALLDGGIGDDILSSYDNGILQPVFSVIAKGCEEEQKEQFIKIITDTLEGLVKNGFEEKSLLAAINYYEFKYREADFGSFPKGLMYGIQIMDSWLYDEEKPFLHIGAHDTFSYLKEKVGTGYYEDLIQKYLLNNTHGTIVIIAPKKGLTEEKEKEEAQRLRRYKESLSQKEIKMLVEETKALKDYQEEPSPQEELLKIPMLSREDIDKRAKPLLIKETEIKQVPVIYHEIFTNGIGYLKLAFCVDDLKGYGPYLAFLSNVIGEVDTENYTYLAYSNEVNIHTGGIFTDINLYPVYKEPDSCRGFFEVRTKVLFQNLGKAISLIEEMLFHTKLDHEKRLKEILSETRSRLEMKLQSSGHSMAVSRSFGYFSEFGYLNDEINGVGYYRFLDDLLVHFDERKQELVQILKGLVCKLFQKERLVISYTASENNCGYLEAELIPLLERLEPGLDKEEPLPVIPQMGGPKKRNEGLKTSGQVQYVARTGNFIRKGLPYTGALKILKVILSYDYLWNEIRVKGGAYGCMCGFSREGNSFLVSYRDPGLSETNRIFEETVAYLEDFSVSERDMTKYVIGAISTMDTPLNPSAQGSRSFSAYLCKISQEDLQRERDQVLNAKEEDIRRLSAVVKALLEEDCICVIGNEKKILENKDLFLNIEPLF